MRHSFSTASSLPVSDNEALRGLDHILDGAVSTFEKLEQMTKLLQSRETSASIVHRHRDGSIVIDTVSGSFILTVTGIPRKNFEVSIGTSAEVRTVFEAFSGLVEATESEKEESYFLERTECYVSFISAKLNPKRKRNKLSRYASGTLLNRRGLTKKSGARSESNLQLKKRKQNHSEKNLNQIKLLDEKRQKALIKYSFNSFILLSDARKVLLPEAFKHKMRT